MVSASAAAVVTVLCRVDDISRASRGMLVLDKNIQPSLNLLKSRNFRKNEIYLVVRVVI